MKRIVILLLISLCSIMAPVKAIAENDCTESANGTPCVSNETPVRIELTRDQIDNLGIKLGTMEIAEEIPLMNASGRVIVPPDRERIISTSVDGLLSRIHVAEGDSVTQGQLLAQINSPELLALQREYLKNASELHLAEAVYQRDRKLQQEGIIPQRRWEETRSRHQLAKSHTQETKQLLLIAGMSEAGVAQLQTTKRLNSQLDVTAPTTGTILERMAGTGERLASNTPLFRIADLEQLWLELAVPQDRIAEITVGDRVRVENTTVLADITVLGSNVDNQTQTVLARAVITAPQSELRPGQTVNTQVVKVPGDTVFKIPQSALVQSEGRNFVFIQTEKGFNVQTVEVEGRQDDFVFVSGAFDAREIIVVRGAAALKAKWLDSENNE